MARIKYENQGISVYMLAWPVCCILWLNPGLQSGSVPYFSGRTADIRMGEASGDTLSPALLFTRADADKIMGEPTRLTDSSFKAAPEVSSYLCGYQANSKDSVTGRTGAIYFLFEQYKDISGARIKFESIYASNKPYGAEKVSSLGDEAYYHTDKQNFDFIMVRKGNYVFNMKVNKRTSTTSLNEFKKVAGRIAASV